MCWCAGSARAPLDHPDDAPGTECPDKVSRHESALDLLFGGERRRLTPFRQAVFDLGSFQGFQAVDGRQQSRSIAPSCAMALTHAARGALPDKRSRYARHSVNFGGEQAASLMRGLNRPPEEEKMLAFRLLQAQRQPEFQDVPEPHAGPGQVVVRVVGSGLCHTSWHIAEPLRGVVHGRGSFVPSPTNRSQARWFTSDTPTRIAVRRGHARKTRG
jgi:hypothetical protein